jgi:uroporphyrinogen-III synthase
METEETIEKTFALIRSCGFDQVNIKTLDYMIGSDLYNSLCDSLKSSDHVFACSENGLTRFSIAELIRKRDEFHQSYYAKHRAELAEKIRQFGSPYSP